jgi:hypothetical protein
VVSAMGIKLNFPNTSSTCYQSYCEAASVLIEHLEKFLEFLEFVCDRKEKGTFTHMEDNLYKALQCKSTITKLAVLAMYSQAISHPVMVPFTSLFPSPILDPFPLITPCCVTNVSYFLPKVQGLYSHSTDTATIL